MVNAGEDVLVFYNDKVSCNYFIQMMQEYKRTKVMPEALRLVSSSACQSSS